MSTTPNPGPGTTAGSGPTAGSNPTTGPNPSVGPKPSPFGDFDYGGQPEARPDLFQNYSELVELRPVKVTPEMQADPNYAFTPETTQCKVNPDGTYTTTRVIPAYINSVTGEPIIIFPNSPLMFLTYDGQLVTQPHLVGRCGSVCHKLVNRLYAKSPEEQANPQTVEICPECQKKQGLVRLAILGLSVLGAIGFFAGWHVR